MPTEYTPTTENVRAWWSLRAEPNDLDERHAEFDRWLAQVKAEAVAQALEEAADAVSKITLRGPDNRMKHASTVRDVATRVVREFAATYRKEQTDAD